MKLFVCNNSKIVVAIKGNFSCLVAKDLEVISYVVATKDLFKQQCIHHPHLSIYIGMKRNDLVYHKY
jgi:hypothetical protein